MIGKSTVIAEMSDDGVADDELLLLERLLLEHCWIEYAMMSGG